MPQTFAEQQQAAGIQLPPPTTAITPQPLTSATPITPKLLTPDSPIQVPPQTLPVDLTGAITSGNAMATIPAPVQTETPSSTDTLLKELMGTTRPIATIQPTAPEAQAAVASQNKLASLQAQLQGLNAEAQSNPLLIKQQNLIDYSGKGIASGIVESKGNAQTRQAQLDYAIRAIPIQAQVLAAQAEATGNMNLYKLAQDHLDKVWQAQETNSQNAYEDRVKLIELALSRADKADATKLAALKEQITLNQSDKNTAIQDAQAAKTAAMNNGQADIAAAITQIPQPNINSKTFAADLQKYNDAVATLQGKIITEKKLDTSVVEVGGRKLLVNNQTGATVKDLGAAPQSAATLGTAAQNTLSTYASRIAQSNPQITNLQSGILAMSPANFELQKNLPSALQSSEMQQYMQSARNFINAVLRRESGAVISPTEFADAYAQYLPVPGDQPEVLAQKAQNRNVVEQTFIRGAGPAYQSIDELLGNSAPKLGDINKETSNYSFAPTTQTSTESSFGTKILNFFGIK